ncbi:hypothetical protein CXB51_000604 [Gossypium anomalum]|uniref:Endonuclease/exonuclease/phosphatase domain-containing protein n=1 Tax=Gossypium anomalum TaxID=47600 RepID=A0A8J6DEQ3_9ROSI|nr:hypothetical protein CXB51_000604 [Gossypium anomalum]
MLSTSQISGNIGEGDTHSDDGRNTKKVRFKESVVDDENSMAVDLVPQQIVSWKDKLLGKQDDVTDSVRVPFAVNENKFELLEGDVNTSIIDGIPAIKFSDRVKEILFKEMELTVIVKLLGRNIGYNIDKPVSHSLGTSTRVIYTPVCDIRVDHMPVCHGRVDINPSQNCTRFEHLHMGMAHGRVPIEPKSSSTQKKANLGYFGHSKDIRDYNKAFSQGPWIVYGQYLTVQPWSKHFNPMQPYPSVVVKLDLQTDNQARGRFARLAKSADLVNTTDNSREESTAVEGPFLVECLNGEKPASVTKGKARILGHGCWWKGGLLALLEEENLRAKSGHSAGRIFGNDLGDKMTDKEKSKDFRDSIKVDKSAGEPGQRDLMDLGLSKGPIDKEITGKNGQKNLGQNYKKPLDKSLGKRPIGVSRLGEIDGESFGNFSNSNLVISNGAGTKQENNDAEDLENIKAHYNSIFDKSEGFIVPISDNTLDPGNHFKSSGTTRVPLAESMETISELLSPQILSEYSNTEGCASAKFPRIFWEYNIKYKPNIISLLEPRVSGSKANNIITKLGFQYSHRVEAIGYSGGIWLGWRDSVRLDVIRSHPQRCQNLWSELKNSIPLDQSPWTAIGDFNAILSSSKKFEGLTRGKRCLNFSDFVDSAELYDLGFTGPPFTWHRGSLFERLDHALAKKAWFRNFPNGMVTHLPRIKSDHRPLFLSLNPSTICPRGRPFRFLAGWTEHPGFDDFLNEKWEYSGNMTDTLGKLTIDLKDWNKKVYGNITTRKMDLFKRISNIQKTRDFSSSHHLNQVDLALRQELEIVLHHEELFWKQKARCEWLKFSDRNTKFFHTRTLLRRKNNRITAIRNSNGNWIYDPKDIEDEVNKFFQRLYREIPDPMRSLPHCGFLELDPADIYFLERPVTNEEINEAMFDMAPLEALGSDGFHTLFF